MMRMVLAVLLLAGVGVSGCASPPKFKEVDKTFGFKSSFDAVWTALVETMASDFNYPIVSLEKDSGLISSDWMDITGDSNTGYCDCGGLGLNTENSRTLRFNVFVKKVDSEVVMKVNATFRQVYSLDDSVTERECVSNGWLEQEIYEAVAAKLGEDVP